MDNFNFGDFGPVVQEHQGDKKISFKDKNLKLLVGDKFTKQPVW